jgi:diguanylate cyclase (GGDEF)-like protein/PAS domain S-box-containing protein
MPHHARQFTEIVCPPEPQSDELVREQLGALQAAFRSHLPRPKTPLGWAEPYLCAHAPQFDGRTVNSTRIAFIKDIEGRYLFANAAWEAIGGRNWFGKTDREIWSPEVAADLCAIDSRVLDGLCMCQGLITLRVNGRTIQWLATAFPVGTSSDRFIGGVAIDITDVDISYSAAGRVRNGTSRVTAGYELLDDIPAGIYRMSPEGRFVYANTALLRMLGCTSVGQLSKGQAGPARRDEFLGVIENEGELRRIDAICVRHDGAELRMRETARRVRDSAGRTLFYEGVVEEVLERAQYEVTEADRNRVLEAIANHIPVDDIFREVIEITLDHLPDASCAISTIEGQTLRLRGHCGLPSRFVQAMAAVDIVAGAGNPALVARIGEPLVVGDIEVHPCWANLRATAIETGIRSCTSVPLFSAAGCVTGTFDVYRRTQHAPHAAELEFIESAARLASVALDHLRHMEHTHASAATIDPLTKLPNRTVFERDLDKALHAGQSSRLAVLWVDLDRLTAINENLGHRAGDELLKLVAARFIEVSGNGVHVCRTGGDEFALLLPDISSPAEAQSAAANLVTALRKPFHVEGHDVVVTCSIGVAVYPDDANSAATLLSNADAAMYRAKAWGKNTAERYRPGLNQSNRRLELENDLRSACNHQEFELFYQPQTDMRRRVNGLEALLRWRHPKLGLLMPAQFLSIAEETGLIVDPIGEWVLREACMQYVRWRPQRDAGLRIAINVSAAQVYRTDLPRLVDTILQETGMPAESMEIEVTESVLMHNLEESARKVNALRALGCTIAIDDFGTGYSSLSYLRQLPVDTLKLDKSFLDGLGSWSGDALVRAVTTLARELGLRLIAEGVETEEQMSTLRGIGIDHIQGYLISKPVPAADARMLLN